MPLTPRTRHHLLRILPFGIIWLLSGWLFLAIEFAAVEHTDEWAETAIRMDFRIFVFASIAVTIVGLVLGLLEQFFIHRLFARLSFGKKLLYKVIFYALLFSLVVLIAYPVAASFELKTSIIDPRVWHRYLEFFTSKTHYSTLLQMSASQFLALFYAEIGESIGYRKLLNFFTGKYHKPVEEERIFMFLDMRSSTTLAERLGHHRYFDLLNAFFADLSPAIIDHGGEIYQYAGDEVIVSWPVKMPAENIHCIQCFFQMQRDLARRKDWYMKKFGVFPEFKAGLHCGLVTTGEIGVAKKEIFFTSDVLNATSRIQGLCNTYGVALLVSGDLLEQMTIPQGYVITDIGVTELRGKKESVRLFRVLEMHLGDS